MDLDILLIWIIIGFLLTLNRIYTTNYRYIIEKLIGLGIVIWMSCVNIKYGLALSVFYLYYLIHNNGYSVNEGMGNSNNTEIVVSRYAENLNWLKEEPFNKYTVICYNKGDDDNFYKPPN